MENFIQIKKYLESGGQDNPLPLHVQHEFADYFKRINFPYADSVCPIIHLAHATTKFVYA
jgi:hypothetical protein